MALFIHYDYSAHIFFKHTNIKLYILYVKNRTLTLPCMQILKLLYWSSDWHYFMKGACSTFVLLQRHCEVTYIKIHISYLSLPSKHALVSAIFLSASAMLRTLMRNSKDPTDRSYLSLRSLAFNCRSGDLSFPRFSDSALFSLVKLKKYIYMILIWIY